MGQIKQDINNYDNTTVGYNTSKLTPEQLSIGKDFIAKMTTINSPRVIEKAPAEFGKSTYDKNINLMYSPDMNQQYQDMEHLRGEEQSGLAQFGAMVNQALIGEIVGGGLEAIGYMTDLDMAKRIMEGSEDKFSNTLTETGNKIRQWSKDTTPVYRTYEPNSFSPGHWSWWMSNLPSVASYLSVFIPVGGVLKVASLFAKYMGLAAKLSRPTKWAMKGIAGATVSRLGENGMEAGSTFDDEYQSLISKGYSDDDAKKGASIAAAADWKSNWALLLQDIPEYLFLARVPFGKAYSKNTVASAKAMGFNIAPYVGKSIGSFAKNATSEGAEEGLQYIFSEESKHLADITLDPTQDTSGFGDRLAKYAKSGDMWTSMFFGAAGFGITTGAKAGYDKLISKNKPDDRVQAIRDFAGDLRSAHENLQTAQELGDPVTIKRATDNLVVNLALKHARLGNTNNAIKMLDDLKSATPEEFTALDGISGTTDMSTDTEAKIKLQSSIENYKKDFKKVADLYEKNSKKYEQPIAEQITKHEFLLNKLYDDKLKLNSDLMSSKGKLNSYFTNVTDNNGNQIGVTPNMYAKLNNTIRANSLEKQVKFFTNRVNNPETKDLEKTFINQQLSEVKNDLSTVTNNINNLNNGLSNSEKEAYAKIENSQLPLYQDLLHKQATLDYTDKTIQVHEESLKELKPHTTIDSFKRAYKDRKQQNEPTIPEDIRSAQNEAKNGQESPIVEPEQIDQFVDDVVNGVERTSLEDQQLYENNKVEIEQKLKDKQQEETTQESPVTETEQAEEVIVDPVVEDFTEPVVLDKVEENIDALLNNNQTKKLHNVLWYAKDSTDKSVRIIEQLGANVDFDVQLLSKYGRFKIDAEYGRKKLNLTDKQITDVVTAPIVFEVKMPNSILRKYVDNSLLYDGDNTYFKYFIQDLKDTERLETLLKEPNHAKFEKALTELKQFRANLLSEIQKAGNKKVTMSTVIRENGKYNNTRRNTENPDVTIPNNRSIDKVAAFTKDGKDYKGIPSNVREIDAKNTPIAIGTQLGDIKDAFGRVLPNRGTSGNVYLLVQGDKTPSGLATVVKLNVKHIDSTFANTILDIYKYGIYGDNFEQETEPRVLRGGLNRIIKNTGISYKNILDLIVFNGAKTIQDPTKSNNIRPELVAKQLHWIVEEGKQYLQVGETKYSLWDIVKNSEIKDKVIEHIQKNMLFHMSYNNLSKKLNEIPELKNINFNTENTINFGDFNISKDEYENMSYLGFILAKFGTLQSDIGTDDDTNIFKPDINTWLKFDTIATVDTKETEEPKPATVQTEPVKIEISKPTEIITTKPVVGKPTPVNKTITNKFLSKFENKPVNDNRPNETTFSKDVEYGNESFEPIRIHEAVANLGRLLNIEPIVMQSLIEVASMGKFAYGTLSREGLKLSKLAPKGTEYHEAFHYVSLLLLSDNNRNKLFKEVENIYNVTGTQREKEEWLAESFRKYMLFGEMPIKQNQSKQKRNFIQKVFDWFISVITGINRVPKNYTERLFENIAAGKFKHNKQVRTWDDINNMMHEKTGVVLKSLDELTPDQRRHIEYLQSVGIVSKKMFNGSYWILKENYNQQKDKSDKSKVKYFEFQRIAKLRGIDKWLYTVEENNGYRLMMRDTILMSEAVSMKPMTELGFNYISSMAQFDNIVKNITAFVIKSNSVDSLSSKVNVDYNETKQIFEEMSKDFAENGDTYRAGMFQEVADNFEKIFVPYIKDTIDSLNFREIKQPVEKEDSTDDKQNEESTETVDSAEVGYADLDQHIKASYEYSDIDRVLGQVKLFLLTQPKVEFSEDGSIQLKQNDVTGLLEFNDLVSLKTKLDNIFIDKPTYKEQIDTLHQKGKVDPIFEYLANQLEKQSDVFKTQFAVTFNKFKHTMTNLKINTTKEGVEATLIDANIQKSENNYIKQWGVQLAMSNVLFDEYGNLNNEAFTNIKKEFDDFSDTFKKSVINSRRNDITEPYFKLIEKFADILSKVGIGDVTMNPLVLNGIINEQSDENAFGYKVSNDHIKLFNYLTNKENNLTYLFSDEGAIGLYAKGKRVQTNKSRKENKVLNYKDTYINEGSVKSFAKQFVKTYPDIAENSLLNENGDNIYLVSQHFYISNRLQWLRTDDTELDKALLSTYNSSSFMLNAMKNDRKIRDNVKVDTMLSILDRGKGRNHLDLSPAEDYLMKMTAIQNNKFVSPTLADKKPWFLIEGFKTFLQPFRYENNQMTFDKDVLDYFKTAFLSEFDSMKEANAFIKAKGKDSQELVEFYHKNGKGNFNKEGNGLRFRHFNKLNETTFNNKQFREQFKTVDDVIAELERLLIKDEKTLDAYINKSLRLLIHDELIRMNDLKLIEYDKTKALKGLKNISLDANRHKSLNDYYQNDSDAVLQMASEFVINNVISIIEFEKLFSQDSAFYKTRDDVVKRLSALSSTGDNLQTNAIKRTSYTSTILKDNQITSAFIDTLYNRIYDAEYSKYLNNGYTEEDATTKAETIAESVVEGYGNNDVNQTDAQVYISPKMYRDLLIMLGEWNNEYENAFNTLETEDWKNNPEMSVEALKLVMQPLKMMYFGVTAKDKLNIPTFDKMSLACVFKSMTDKESGLRQLYNRMNKEGDNIDMVKFESAVKVGMHSAQSFYTTPENTEISDLDKLPLYTQEFKNLRRQLLTDPHHVTEASVGTQVVKAVMSNIDKNAEYTLNDQHITGKELLDVYTNSINTLTEYGKQNLLNELGATVDENNNITGIDKAKLVNLLATDAKNSNMPSNVRQALQMVNDEMLMELSAFPDASWIESRFISMINSKVIDLVLPGNAFIQMSNFGWKKTSSRLEKVGENIVITKGDKTLADITKSQDLPNYIKNRELAFIDDDNRMECILSINLFKHLLPETLKNASIEEQGQYLLKNDNLESIGYRIPTQGLASIAALKIVDVLPSTVGDTIVLPAEFTKQTGSDFDIDKLYVMTYNYKATQDGMFKTEFDDSKNYSENSKQQIQNRLIDSFMSVLKDPKHLSETRMPLDRATDIMKNEILKKVDEAKEYGTGSKPNFYFASPMYQSDKKFEFNGGKAGIGPFALNNVHHVFTQSVGLNFNQNFITDMYNIRDLSGVVGLDDVKILDWLSALINAHVDVAKDPYVIRLNIVKYTWAMSNFLIRTGKGKSSFYFLAQPVFDEILYRINNNKGNLGKDVDEHGNVISKKDGKIEYEVLRDYLKKLAELAKTSEEKELAKALASSKNNDTKYITYNDKPIVFDEQWLIKNLKKEETFEWYKNQVLILKSFRDLQPLAKSMSQLVNASQIDTKKYGNSVTALKQFKHSLDKVLEETVFENVSKVFENTFLYNKALNSVGYKGETGLVNKLFNNILITSTPMFLNLHDNLLRNNGKLYFKDEVLLKNFKSGIVSSIYSRFFNSFAESRNLDYNKLFFGEKSMANRLAEFKKMIKTDERLWLLKDSPLLNMMIPDIHEREYITVDDKLVEKPQNEPDIITTPGNRITDTGSKNIVTMSWKEILTFTSDDTKLQNAVRNFGEDLVVYALLQSGFKPGLNTIHQYVPFEYLIDIKFNKFVKDTINSINNGNFTANNVNTDDIYRNMWYNDNLVPEVKVNEIPYKHRKVQNGELQMFVITAAKANDFNEMNLYTGTNQEMQPLYRPFIKIKESFDKSNLYKYVGYIVDNDMQANPIYELTNKKGYYTKGKSILEFSDDTKSQFVVNNVKDTEKPFNYTPITNYTVISNSENTYFDSDPVFEKTSVLYTYNLSNLVNEYNRYAKQNNQPELSYTDLLDEFNKSIEDPTVSVEDFKDALEQTLICKGLISR